MKDMKWSIIIILFLVSIYVPCGENPYVRHFYVELKGAPMPPPYPQLHKRTHEQVIDPPQALPFLSAVLVTTTFQSMVFFMCLQHGMRFLP